MKVMKIRTFVIFGFASLAGAALLHTSQSVQQAEERLAVIDAEIQKERDTIHMLNAEWEYLNRPERLEKLAQEFLGLVPPSPETMTDTMVNETAALPEKPLLEEEGFSLGDDVQPVHFEQPEAPEMVTAPEVQPAQDVLPVSAEAPRAPAPKPSALKAKPQTKDFGALLDELSNEKEDAP